MALILRVDVDRPYGKRPAWRHVLSRIASDAYFPPIQRLGYLDELAVILRLLNAREVRSHVFFRRCTAPSAAITRLIEGGGHEVGLHLEDSRSFESFEREKTWLERNTGRRIRSCSKHGSGRTKFGRRHYAPYEPDKYLEWARRANISVFLGNLEDPTLRPHGLGGVIFYPSAFWLEPPWRDDERFSTSWLKQQAGRNDIVLLIHPENVLDDPALTQELLDLVSSVPVTLV